MTITKHAVADKIAANFHHEIRLATACGAGYKHGHRRNLFAYIYMSKDRI